MDAKDYRELSLKDLRGRSEELKTEIFRLRLKMDRESAAALKDWRASRKDLARLLTVIGEKERAAPAK